MKNKLLLIGIWTLATLFILAYLLVQVEESSEISLSYSVKGCAETENGLTTRGPLQTDRGPSIVVSEGEVSYSRALNHLCCRKAVVEKEIRLSEINIFEVWGGQGCRCMCFSEIEANLSNLTPGKYMINVYETGTKPGSEEPLENREIIRQEITVN
ncbi:MAG: hypothetical protein ABIG39_04610 [Candidatus Micrarchaeota archaeon]